MNVNEAKVKIDELLEQGHGEVELLVNVDGTMSGVEGIHHEVVEEDDLYPEDWNMPPGSEHITLDICY